MNEKREPAAPAAEAEEARLATQAEEEIPAPVERPGFMGKLAWYLFGEEEPAAESEKREPAAPPIIVNSWPISPAESPREEPDEAATAPESLETRASAKAKAAETAERPGFTRKLSSFLFGEQEEGPRAVPPSGQTVGALLGFTETVLTCLLYTSPSPRD